MKQLGVWAAAVISLFVLEVSLMPYFAFRGVGPDFLLIFAVSLTILQGTRLGVFSAFCFGLLEDIVIGSFCLRPSLQQSFPRTDGFAAGKLTGSRGNSI